MNSASDRDEWLMAQVAQEKREHLEPLIRRYASPLLTFIRRMVGDPHRSEELFQEVFLSVWKNRRQYRFPRPFKAWLYAIALNACRASFRQPALRIAGAVAEGSPMMPTAPDPSPEERLMTVETAALVSSAVTQLPPQQRAVVVLRIWDGLSYAEIAAAMGRSEATIRSNMHHGLATLRKTLEPHLAG